MYCKYCGQPIDDNADFCTSCGRRLDDGVVKNGKGKDKRQRDADYRENHPRNDAYQSALADGFCPFGAFVVIDKVQDKSHQGNEEAQQSKAEARLVVFDDAVIEPSAAACAEIGVIINRLSAIFAIHILSPF